MSSYSRWVLGAVVVFVCGAVCPALGQFDDSKVDPAKGLLKKSVDLSFVVPTDASVGDLSRYKDSIGEVLACGFGEAGSKKKTPADAKRAFEKSRSILRDDPRAYMAYALVQLRREQAVDALKTLKDARDRGGYLPAFQLRILYLLYQDSQSDAAKEMQALARSLVESEQPDEEKNRWAKWLGSIVEYFEKAGEGEKKVTGIRAMKDAIRSCLEEAQQAAFDEGRTEQSEQFLKMSKKAKEETEKVDDEVRKELDPLLDEIKAGKLAAEVKAENLKKSQEEWEAWYGKQMEMLRRAMTLLLQYESGLRAEYHLWRQTPAQTVSGADRIDRMLFGLGLKIAETERSRQQVALQIQHVTALYAQGTGKNIQGHQELKAWDVKLEDLKKRFETNVPKSAEDKKETMDKKLRNIRTYFHVDLEDYRQQVLKSFDAAK